MGSPLRWLKALISLLFPIHLGLDILDGRFKVTAECGSFWSELVLECFKLFANMPADRLMLRFDRIRQRMAKHLSVLHIIEQHILIGLSIITGFKQSAATYCRAFIRRALRVPHWGDLVLGLVIVSHVRPTSEHPQDGEANHRQG